LYGTAARRSVRFSEVEKPVSAETVEEFKKDIFENWQKYRQWYISKLKTE